MFSGSLTGTYCKNDLHAYDGQSCKGFSALHPRLLPSDTLDECAGAPVVRPLVAAAPPKPASGAHLAAGTADVDADSDDDIPEIDSGSSQSRSDGSDDE